MKDSYGDPRKAKIEIYLSALILSVLIVIFNILPTWRLYQERVPSENEIIHVSGKLESAPAPGIPLRNYVETKYGQKMYFEVPPWAQRHGYMKVLMNQHVTDFTSRNGLPVDIAIRDHDENVAVETAYSVTIGDTHALTLEQAKRLLSRARLAGLLTALASLILVPSHLYAGYLVTRRKFGKHVPRIATIQLFLFYAFLLWAEIHIL